MSSMLSSKRKTIKVQACEQELTLTELSAFEYYKYYESLGNIIGTKENPKDSSLADVKKSQGELVAMSLMPNFPDHCLMEIHNDVCNLSMSDFKILHDAAAKLMNDAMQVDNVVVKKTEDQDESLLQS